MKFVGFGSISKGHNNPVLKLMRPCYFEKLILRMNYENLRLYSEIIFK